jgi:pilus assembly protein CpaE
MMGTPVATVEIECGNTAVRGQFEHLLASCSDFRLRRARGHRPPDLLILECDATDPSRTFSTVKGILATDPHAEVFLTADHADSQLILEAFRSGVKEFLPQPIAEPDLEAAIGRFLDRFRARPPVNGPKQGTVISVIGVKGGVGTSTVAVNLAVSMRQTSPDSNPVLVDLNFYDDELAIFLDAKTPRGLRDLSGDVSRLDETMLESVLEKHETGLRLLSTGGYDELLGARPAPGCALRAIELLRGMFPYVFVDVGQVLEPSVRETLASSDLIMVVTTLTVPAIRRLQQLLKLLRTPEFSQATIQVVVNRYHATDQELLRHMEEVIQMKASWVISMDDTAANGSLNKGVPLVSFAPKAVITKEYLRQVARLIGTASVGKTEKQEGVLARWFPFLVGKAPTTSS